MKELEEVSMEYPFIPGTLEGFSNKNASGEKYGSYNRLSYNLKGKNSSLFVKQKDLKQIKLFTDNYKGLREYVMEEGVKNLELLHKKGIDALLKKYQYSQKISSYEEKNIMISRDKWRCKSLEQTKVIAKNKRAIKDAHKSSDNWKEKYKLERKKRIELEKHNKKNSVERNQKDLKKNS